MSQEPTSDSLTDAERAAIVKMRERSTDREAKIRAREEIKVAARITEMKAREEIKAAARITEMKACQEIKAAAKIAEMKAREELKVEREERRAAAKSKATAEWAEHQKAVMREKKSAGKEAEKRRIKEQKRKAKERAKAVKLATAEKTVMAAARIERDREKAKTIGDAKTTRLRDRQLRDLQKKINAVDFTDAVEWMKLRDDRRTRRMSVNQETLDRWKPREGELGAFLHWDSGAALDRIMEDVDLEGDPEKLADAGMAVIDNGKALAIAWNHRAVMDRLECGRGYPTAFRDHPRMIKPARAVWIGDTPQKCMIFALPIDGPSPA